MVVLDNCSAVKIRHATLCSGCSQNRIYRTIIENLTRFISYLFGCKVTIKNLIDLFYLTHFLSILTHTKYIRLFLLGFLFGAEDVGDNVKCGVEDGIAKGVISIQFLALFLIFK